MERKEGLRARAQSKCARVYHMENLEYLDGPLMPKAPRARRHHLPNNLADSSNRILDSMKHETKIMTRTVKPTKA